MDHHPKS
jgi:hypothetical protein